MAPVLPLVCIVCVVLGGSLGRASLEAEFGLSIHPALSSPVYIAKDPQQPEDPSEKEEQKVGQSQPECEILNSTEPGQGLYEVKTLPRRSFSFFVKPESSFKRLVFKLKLQNVLYVSNDFYSDEDFTLSTEDLAHSEGSQWTQVRVEHYQYKRRGLDRHAFRIFFANVTLVLMTHDSWLLHGFQGFTVFAEGGAKILFNCAPEDLNKAPVESYMVYSMWVMAGLMIAATFLLVALCCVWVYLKYQRKKKLASVSTMRYPMYDEFDEEVLERVKEKVEALRKGKSVADPDTVVVSYPPRQENLYVLDLTEYGEAEGGRSEEHQYEDIEKYYKHMHATGNVYQNADDDGHGVSAVDNIYESLPCFENYVEKRGDEARASARY